DERQPGDYAERSTRTADGGPRRSQPRVSSTWSEGDGLLRPHKKPVRDYLREWISRAKCQRDGERSRQQGQHGRWARDAAAPGSRTGIQDQHAAIFGGERTIRGRSDQHDYQVRDELVSRFNLRIFPGRGLKHRRKGRRWPWRSG